MDSQHISEAVKASPPIAVTSLSFVGVGLSDWVLILTIIYTVLQIGLLIRDKIWKRYGNKNTNKS